MLGFHCDGRVQPGKVMASPTRVPFAFRSAVSMTGGRCGLSPQTSWGGHSNSMCDKVVTIVLCISC
jgi:hypothetical protein